MSKIAARLLKSVVSCQLSVVIILFSLFTLTLTFAPPAHAQECQPSTGNFEYGKVINDFNKCAISKNIFDDKIFNWNQIVGTADSLNVLITGSSLNHPQTNEITANASALAGISRGITLAYAAPPVSGVEYFAQQIQKFNPVQPAYAQGFGYRALKPTQEVWTAFRNAAYIGFVIIFVVIGFMIMFRTHISPQAVATVQDSIPRIVVALILVTFSYAIAGLMVDLMYLIINIAIALLSGAGLDTGSAQNVFKENIFQMIFGGWRSMVDATKDVIGNVLKKLFEQALTGTGCGIFDIGGCAGKAVAWMLGWIGGMILGIAVLFVMVRVFLMLLMAYVTIILLTVFAPFFFLIQALPGNTGAKEWFKQMASNIAVFPAVAIMFLLAGLLGGIGHFGGSGAGTFGASDQFFDAPLLTSGFTGETIGKLIAIGVILMIPSAAQMVKEFIGAKGPGFGGAGVAALGAAGGFAGNRVAQSRFGRAFGDIMEERGRSGTQRLLTRLGGTTPPSPGAPAGTPATPNIPARGKLPH